MTVLLLCAELATDVVANRFIVLLKRRRSIAAVAKR
jgi:hypothetical protein